MTRLIWDFTIMFAWIHLFCTSHLQRLSPPTDKGVNIGAGQNMSNDCPHSAGEVLGFGCLSPNDSRGGFTLEQY